MNARLVLRDNIEQNVALGVARAQALAMLPVHRRLMAHLERQGDWTGPWNSCPTTKNWTNAPHRDTG